MNQTAEENIVPLGIIGCGRITRGVHLRALVRVPSLRVVALADPDESALAAAAAAAPGDPRTYTDPDDLLTDEALRSPRAAVAVCTPPALHAAIGLDVLSANRHLYLEKPIALSMPDADRLIQEARNRPVRAVTGFNYRAHRLIRRAASILRKGETGPMEFVRTVFCGKGPSEEDSPSWRRRPGEGGDVFLDLGVHHFDLLRTMLGDEIETVRAILRAGEDGMTALVSGTLRNGVPFSVTLSNRIPGVFSLEFQGQRARLGVSCFRFDGLNLESGGPGSGETGRRLRRSLGVLVSAPAAVLRARRGGDFLGAYERYWRWFADAVLGREDPPVADLEDGRRSLQAALAAAEAARTGRPVPVAPDPGNGATLSPGDVSPRDEQGEESR